MMDCVVFLDRFCDFLAQLKPGSRVMTYHDLQSMYDRAGYISPFDRITRVTDASMVV